MTEIVSELDEALEIARNLRKDMISNKGSMESHLLAFYSIAQMLGKKDMEDWSHKELRGYGVGDEIPDYRGGLYANINDGEKKVGTLFDVQMEASALKIDAITRDPKEFVIWGIGTREKLQVEQILKRSITDSYHLKIPRVDFTMLSGSIKHVIISKLNIMISEIVYGKIPQGIFKNFQTKVNAQLSNSNPDAISELNIAYESLGRSEETERIAHVAFACRRLIKAISDQLFPPKKGKQYTLKIGDVIEIGEENFLNRLMAYVDNIDSSNKKFIIKELKLLRDLYSEIPESINKGTHLTITNADAERLLIYTYIILGDVILENEKLSKGVL